MGFPSLISEDMLTRKITQAHQALDEIAERLVNSLGALLREHKITITIEKREPPSQG